MSDISLQITADNGPLIAALTEARAAVTDATEQMRGAFEGIAGVFEKVTGALAVFTAALAGGRAFKEAIDATVELTTGAVSLGRQFGISATQASDLRVALDDIHVSTDTFQAAGAALTRQLSKNESAFKAAGIATRDSSGELRNQLDILLDATAHLANLKEGTDRNIEGQRLFGRAWQEVSPIVRLTSDTLREAGERAAALGLEVGGEQVAATRRYRDAMAGAHDVLLGVENAIGTALLPTLTQLAEWFGSIGPGVVEGFRIALAGVETAFRLLVLPIQIFWTTISTVFEQAKLLVQSYASVVNKELHGDFAGATAAWQSGMAQIEQVGKEGFDKIAKDAADAQQKIVESFTTAIVGPKVTPTAPGGEQHANDEAEAEKRKKVIEELATYAIELDTRVTTEHARLIEQQTRATEQANKEQEKQLEELSNFAQDLDTRVTQEHARVVAQMTAVNAKLAADQAKEWQTLTNAISNSFASAFQGMLTGGQSFGAGMRNVFASVANAAAQSAAKNLATIAQQALVGNTLRSQEIRKDAGAGAAAAYKAVVGIPVVGPILAPIAAGVAYAGILAFDSAERGYDIPAGLNPLTQLHEREMVLPRQQADVVRGLAGRNTDGTDPGASGPPRRSDVNIKWTPVGNGSHGLVSRDQIEAIIRDLHYRFVFP